MAVRGFCAGCCHDELQRDFGLTQVGGTVAHGYVDDKQQRLSVSLDSVQGRASRRDVGEK
jgi:hypothetical protein